MNWPLVSILVVTYDRINTLQETVFSLKRICSYPNMEWILADDGSPKSIQDEMRNLPFDRFLFSKKNRGLGANFNNGLKAAKGEYILQLEDDWKCLGPSDFIEAGVNAMQENTSVGMVRYRNNNDLENYEQKKDKEGRRIRIFKNDQKCDAKNQLLYTNNPHLKPASFHKMLGFYQENVPMTKMELEFCDRFSKRSIFNVAYIENYEVFKHIGDECSYNPGKKRARLKRSLEKNIVTRCPFCWFLSIKNKLKR